MPVRVRAVDKALRSVLGSGHTMSFNNIHMTVKVNGTEMSRDEFEERFWEPVDRAYEAVVEHIDWKRVLLEATSRHIALNHPDDDYTGMVCAECIWEALLADETHYSWEKNPRVERKYDQSR